MASSMPRSWAMRLMTAGKGPWPDLRGYLGSAQSNEGYGWTYRQTAVRAGEDSVFLLNRHDGIEMDQDIWVKLDLCQRDQLESQRKDQTHGSRPA